MKRHCPRCSAAVPMPRPSSRDERDLVSKGNFERLKKACSPKYLKDKVRIFEDKFTEEDIDRFVKEGWTPWSHRSYKQSAPDKVWI